MRSAASQPKDGHPHSSRESGCVPPLSFSSFQALDRLQDAHSHWGRRSASLSPRHGPGELTQKTNRHRGSHSA